MVKQKQEKLSYQQIGLLFFLALLGLVSIYYGYRELNIFWVAQASFVIGGALIALPLVVYKWNPKKRTYPSLDEKTRLERYGIVATIFSIFLLVYTQKAFSSVLLNYLTLISFALFLIMILLLMSTKDPIKNERNYFIYAIVFGSLAFSLTFFSLLLLEQSNLYSVLGEFCWSIIILISLAISYVIAFALIQLLDNNGRSYLESMGRKFVLYIGIVFLFAYLWLSILASIFL